MDLSFEQTIIEVWRQVLVENSEAVELGTERYSVRRTPKRHLRQVDFVFAGNKIRALEQDPETKSRWAQMARAGEAASYLRDRDPLILVDIGIDYCSYRQACVWTVPKSRFPGECTTLSSANPRSAPQQDLCT